jgi:hypothetical protein
MSGKASQRGRFFGRRKPRTVEALERLAVEEAKVLDPMRREDWWRFLDLQTELEEAKTN